MRWVDTPHVAPYKCSLCGNDGSNVKHRPFCLLEWRYSEPLGNVQFREQVESMGECRLILCSVCVTAIAREKGSPLRGTINDGVLAEVARNRGEVPTNDPITAEERRTVEIIAAYEQEKVEKRMEKARAARAQAGETP